MIALAWVAAVLVVLGGLQLLGRLIQGTTTDHRPPGPLIELTSRRRPTIQPLDVDVLESLVGDGLLSDSHLERNLLPLLQQMAADSPGPRVVIDRPGRRRSRWLEETLTELEASWGLDTSRGQGD